MGSLSAIQLAGFTPFTGWVISGQVVGLGRRSHFSLKSAFQAQIKGGYEGEREGFAS
jgi:hypothetical protein